MSNEQKKNASQNRRPRQSSTQKNKDGSDKKRSYKQQVEWKLHPVAEDKDLASNILKNTNMDIDLDEINLLLRSVDKQQPNRTGAGQRAGACIRICRCAGGSAG